MTPSSRVPTRTSAERSARTRCFAGVLRAFGAVLLAGSASGQALVNGGVVHGSISAPGEEDTYTFDARIGDRFEMRMVDADASDFEPRIELFNPLGALLTTSANADVAVIDTRHVVFGTDYRPGTYTVVVSNASSAGSQTGAYDLRFILFPGAQTSGELLDGVRIFGEIERGELDSFTFTTVAGQPVEGTVIALEGGTLRLRVERFSAGGYSEGIGDLCRFTTTTWPGGVQMLVISDGSPDGSGTGRYSLVVHGAAATPPYPPSLFLPGERRNDPLLLDNAGDPGLGPRIGNAGEPFNVSLDCTSADAPSVYALVLSTHGHGAVSTSLGWSYLDGPALLRTVGNHAQSVEPWFPVPAGLPLPADPTLIGLSYTVQGVCGGFAGALRLSSAITQTIGS